LHGGSVTLRPACGCEVLNEQTSLVHPPAI
jgi:hypothetical protein